MNRHGKFAPLIGTLAVTGTLLATSSTAHEPSIESAASGYQMAAVIDKAKGTAVLAGDYARAIEGLGKRARPHFEASTNLCIAYTMSGDLQNAGTECDTALDVSEKIGIPRDIAVALSNRGVVRAVRGDISGAREDFRRAIALDSHLRQASENLQLLSDDSGQGA